MEFNGVFAEPDTRLPPRAVVAGLLGVLAGFVGVLASVLPWWSVSISGPLFALSKTYPGTHAWVGWGSIVAGVGLVVAGVVFLAGASRVSRPFYSGHAVTLGLGLIAFAIVGTVQANALANVLGASVGIAGGQFISLAAGLAAVLGGVLAGTNPREVAEEAADPSQAPPVRFSP